MGQEFRINWQYDESLEDFRRKVSSRDRVMKGYEAKRFDQGWMYIEWTTYRPAFNQEYRPKTELESTVFKALSSGKKEFIFDEHRKLWRAGELYPQIKGLFTRINPRMEDFLRKFDGKSLLLDRTGESFNDNWSANRNRISWFLKRL